MSSSSIASDDYRMGIEERESARAHLPGVFHEVSIPVYAAHLDIESKPPVETFDLEPIVDSEEGDLPPSQFLSDLLLASKFSVNSNRITLALTDPIPQHMTSRNSPEEIWHKRHGVVAISFEIPPRSKEPDLSNSVYQLLEREPDVAQPQAILNLPPHQETFATQATCMYALDDPTTPYVPIPGAQDHGDRTSPRRGDSFYICTEPMLIRTDIVSLKGLMDQMGSGIVEEENLPVGSFSQVAGSRPTTLDQSWFDYRLTLTDMITFERYEACELVTSHTTRALYRPFLKQAIRPDADPDDPFHLIRLRSDEAYDGHPTTGAISSLVPEARADLLYRQLAGSSSSGAGRRGNGDDDGRILRGCSSEWATGGRIG